MADSLKRYSLPPEQYAALRATQVAEAKALGTVDEIRFEGLERTNPEVLRALVESKPGEPLSEEKIGADLRRIYGTRRFREHRLPHHAGTPARARWSSSRGRSRGGPTTCASASASRATSRATMRSTLLVQYRKTWLNRLGGEWLTEGQVGQDTHLWSEFYQPVDETGRWFVAPYGKIGQADARRLRRRRQGRRLSRAAWDRSGSTAARFSALGDSCEPDRCGRGSTRASTRVLPSCRRSRKRRRGSGRCCSSTRPTMPFFRITALGRTARPTPR